MSSPCCEQGVDCEEDFGCVSVEVDPDAESLVEVSAFFVGGTMQDLKCPTQISQVFLDLGYIHMDRSSLELGQAFPDPLVFGLLGRQLSVISSETTPRDRTPTRLAISFLRFAA